MHCLFIYSFIGIIAFVISQSDAKQCYVCGTGAEEPFKNIKPYNNDNDHSSSNNSNNDRKDYNHDRSKSNNNNEMEYKNFSGFHGMRKVGVDVANPIFTSCQEFETRRPLLHEFIMECPPDYMGCITQIDGDKVTRTCEALAINDCQIANHIKYCYCSTDLCNGEDISKLSEEAMLRGKGSNRRQVDFLDDNIDDEDMNESSGLGGKTILRETTEYTSVSVSIMVPSSNSSPKFDSLTIIVIAIILFIL